MKLLYRYRDAGNYKNFGEVIFRNNTGLVISDIDDAIRQYLIDEQWFVADKWELPDLHFREFSWNSELDHEWHEYEALEAVTDADTPKEDIADFLKRIRGIKR